MARLMKMDKKPEADPRCLNCHGFSERDPKLLNDPKTIVTEGVTCVVCHGAFDEWVGAHHGNFGREKRLAWRDLSREEKEKKWGMRDLVGPGEAERACVRLCHVGSVRGRAGAHARDVRRGPPAAAGLRGRRLQRGDAPLAVPRGEAARGPENPRIQKRREGAGGTRRRGRRGHLRVGDVPAADECGTSPASRWLDSRRASTAPPVTTTCIAELASAARLRRAAGRPPAWPSALLRAAAGHAGESLKEYDERSDRLKKVFGDQPFGKPALVAEEAGQLADWAAALAKRVAAVPMDQAAARRSCGCCATCRPASCPTTTPASWPGRSNGELADLDPKPAKSDVLVALDREFASRCRAGGVRVSSSNSARR